MSDWRRIWLVFLLLGVDAVFGCRPALAAGTDVATCTPLGNSGIVILKFAWVGDASTGSVPAAAANCILTPGVNLQGYRLMSAETVPGSPAPTANYTATITDANGLDELSGLAAGNLAASGSQAFSVPSNLPLSGVLTLNITGNMVASAQGTVYAFLAPPLFAKSGGGSSGTTILAAKTLFGNNGASAGAGTGLTASTVETLLAAAFASGFSQKFFGSGTPGSISGNTPGDVYYQTSSPYGVYGCLAAAGTPASACTAVTAGGWTQLNAAGALEVDLAGVAKGTRPILNIQAGTGITPSCADNSSANRVDCSWAYNTALMPTHDTVHAANPTFVSSSNGTTGYTATMPNKSITAYTVGMSVVLETDTTCSSSCSLTVDGVTPGPSIKQSDGSTDPGGALVAHRPQLLTLGPDTCTIGSTCVWLLPPANIAANAVNSSKMAVVNTYRNCDIPVGDASGSALTDAQLGPQKHVCKIPAAATVVEIDVDADAGSPTAIVGRGRCTTFTAGTCSAETIVNLTSSSLAVSSGFEKCSNAGGTTGIDGGTTCAATLQNTGLNAGDWFQLVSGSAGGTAKLFVAHVIYTVN